MKKKLIIMIPAIIAIIAFVGVYRYYNKEDSTTTLTVTEKKWIQDNGRESVDFEVINDYPLYGLNGKGVFFTFFNDLKKDIGIDFNKISYLKDEKPSSSSFSFRILDNNEKLKDNDLLLFEDYYVAIGKEYQRINHISDMKNLTFGVFKEESEDVRYYLKSANNLSFKTYDNINSLFEAIDKNEVNMVIVPNIMYLNRTIDNSKYSINYYFTELKKRIVLTLGSSEEKLNNIVRKYYKKWKATKYVSEYNDAYLDYYVKEKKLSAKEKNDLTSKVYVYGYIENSPYEVFKHGHLKGIAAEYVDRISRLTNIEFKYKEYKNKKELQKAINKGKVDFYFDYYGINNSKYLSTLSTFIEDYVILGRNKDNHIINSFESLKDEDIVMLKGNSLYQYVKTNSRANITSVNTVEELTKKAKDKILVVDREVYNYYRQKLFSDYTVLYTDTMMNDYKFMVKKSNKSFYNLFNYIMNTNSYYNYKNSGIENLDSSFLKDKSFSEIYIDILLIIFLPILIFVILYFILKRKKKNKKIRIDDRHKYTDMLTSLKNRNYLNAKIQEWEDSKVFPQAIVIADLNNVKYVNDNYGHEEGDQLIVKAAGVLVNTQLENSEIIRTDGNEFLIYLVGYNDKQISTYVKKLSKEFKNLPHEFGAGVGYSMIEDEIKTIDDAINEATLEMITNKEDFK